MNKTTENSTESYMLATARKNIIGLWLSIDGDLTYNFVFPESEEYGQLVVRQGGVSAPFPFKLIETEGKLCLEIDEIKHTIIELRTGSDSLLAFNQTRMF